MVGSFSQMSLSFSDNPCTQCQPLTHFFNNEQIINTGLTILIFLRAPLLSFFLSHFLLFCLVRNVGTSNQRRRWTTHSSEQKYYGGIKGMWVSGSQSTSAHTDTRTCRYTRTSYTPLLRSQLQPCLKS